MQAKRDREKTDTGKNRSVDQIRAPHYNTEHFIDQRVTHQHRLFDQLIIDTWVASI